MGIALYGQDKNRIYELGKEIKSGGEGVVYALVNRPNSVAKVYKNERIADSQLREASKDKILAMLGMHFNPYYNGRVVVAWPEDALFDDSGFFMGFVMPKIENMKSLIWAMRPSDRDVLWSSGYHWRYSIAIAFNLALTVEHLHNAGVVVGDMNTNNILINSRGNVTLIDADSFNITTKSGQVHKCIVGFPEVLPAELQGKDLTKQKFTERTDVFSLAVHIFTLLCNNCHPFGCLNYSSAHGSSSNPRIMDNIVKGYCPYVSGSSGETVDDALDMEIFPEGIRRLFDRAFRYDATTAIKQETIAMRPSAAEWRIALGNMYSEGVSICTKNPLHEYPKNYHGSCPWCAIEQRKKKAGQPQQDVSSNQFINLNVPTPHISIPVMHCDENGYTLLDETLDIEYGKSRTAYAATIPGYHILGNKEIVVSVDGTGIASEKTVKFIYQKDKAPAKKRRILRWFIAVFLLYCLFIYGLTKAALSNKDYERANYYMGMAPLYKDVFPDDYNSIVSGLEEGNAVRERTVSETYDEAIKNYRNCMYSEAKDLFSSIDSSYKQTSIYLDFCNVHLWGGGDYYTTIYNNIDFEDAKTILTWDDQLFCKYMVGTWTINASNGEQTVKMVDNGGGSYTVNNMPELPDGGTFDISYGTWQYLYPDSDEWIDFFNIEIISKSKFSLYSFKSGNTYTFIRK